MPLIRMFLNIYNLKIRNSVFRYFHSTVLYTLMVELKNYINLETLYIQFKKWYIFRNVVNKGTF